MPMLAHASEAMASTADECIDRLRAIRPTIVIRPEAQAAIRGFFQTVGQPSCARAVNEAASASVPIRVR